MSVALKNRQKMNNSAGNIFKHRTSSATVSDSLRGSQVAKRPTNSSEEPMSEVIPKQLRAAGTIAVAHHKDKLPPFDRNNLYLISGNVTSAMQSVRTSSVPPSALHEIFAFLIKIRCTSSRSSEKMLLLRNSSGPVLQAAFYEIDFELPPLQVGDLVRCVGQFKGNTRFQIYKIQRMQINQSLSTMAQRLQTLSQFILNKSEKH